jgi:hypothetical protein
MTAHLGGKNKGPFNFFPVIALKNGYLDTRMFLPFTKVESFHSVTL